LYDYAYLQAHPLIALTGPAGPNASPGRTLHQILQGAIDALKPPDDTYFASPFWRAYRCLCLRYREMLNMPQVADELGIGPRQCRRAHHEAMEAITSALWRRYIAIESASDRAALSTADPPTNQESSAQLETEMARMVEDSTHEMTDLVGSIDGILITLEPLARVRRVHLSSALTPGVPPVAINHSSLRQLLLAAFQHAIDWVQEGQVVVTAVTGKTLPGPPIGKRVTLSINAFRFVPLQARGNATASPHLVVARQLIASYGGTVEIAGGDERLSLLLALPTGRLTAVLVVDDNPDALRLYRRYLGAGRYLILEASSGPQALESALTAGPDVIILDIMMPVQDGWEILQNLRGHPLTREVPVIVCSVLPEEDLALALGAVAFLPKPLNQQQLLTALDRCAVKTTAHPERV